MIRALRPLLGLLLALTAAAIPAAQTQSAAGTIEQGWLAVRQGDGATAAQIFAEALQRNPKDANLQFGAGAAAHLLGQDGDAAASLTRALTLNPKLTGASELLGRIQYDQGDLDAAIETFEKALTYLTAKTDTERLYADNMTARLEAWRKEAAVQSRLVQRNGARFTITFDGQADQSLASRASAVLDRSYWTISQKIGAYPPNRVLVILYTEQQFRDVAQAPAWAGGVFDGKIRIPVRGAQQQLDDFDRTLIHELTHAMIYGLAPRGVPAWLHEGLAMYFEPRDAALAGRRLQSLGAAIPLTALEGSFSRLNAQQATVAYEQSLFAVDLLMHQVGTRISVLLQSLGSGQSLDASFAQLGMSAADFEAQVARRLRP